MISELIILNKKILNGFLLDLQNNTTVTIYGISLIIESLTSTE